MTPLLRKLLGMNWILLVLTVGLSVFGIYAIYSATWMRDQDFWLRQAIWVSGGFAISIVIGLFHYRWIKWGALPLYLAGLAGLIAVRMIGEEVFGAKSWLNLGFMNFQPSQLAIVAGIMVLALLFTEFPKGNRFLAHPLTQMVLSGAVVGAPWLLILIQPDLGSALVWIPVLLGMWFVSGIPKRYLACVLLIGLAAVPLVVNFGLKPYQRERIVTFLDPSLDPQGAGWTINNSLIAIGSGGWSGKGFKAPNTLNELGFLPKTIVHNDFIFAVLGEQHGFVGGAALLAAFLLLILTGLYIATRAADDFGKLLAIGITMLLFTHTFMNIGMTISVTPITGLPLPLVSYGGSFAAIVLISIGILQSVWIHRKKIPAM